MPPNSSLSGIGLSDAHFYWANSGVWDSANNRVIWVGGPGSCCATTPTYVMVRYNENTNTWQSDNTPYTSSGHAYDGNAFGANKLFFALNSQSSVKVWNGGSWSTLPNVNVTPSVANAMTYFPEADGLVYVGGNGSLAIYREASGWSDISGSGWGDYHVFAEYNPVHGVVWFGSGNNANQKTFRLNSDLSVTQMQDAPFSLGASAAIQVVDPASGKYLVLNRQNNTWWEFDIMANQWSQINNMTNKPGISQSIFAVSLPEHNAIMMYNHGSNNAFLYRHADAEDYVQSDPPGNLQ
ncbi:MAG: hypothetical protein AAFQ99_02970 [Pseudomonadota bacterium]